MFNQFWGSRQLMGNLGGAGYYADLEIQNSAWIRIGLFGGGFGIHLHNLAQAGQEILRYQFPAFKFEFKFKLDMTYAPPIPFDVIGKASDVVNMVISKLEGLKAFLTAFLALVGRKLSFAIKVLTILSFFLNMADINHMQTIANNFFIKIRDMLGGVINFIETAETSGK